MQIKNINERNQFINNLINDNKDGNMPLYKYLLLKLLYALWGKKRICTQENFLIII